MRVQQKQNLEERAAQAKRGPTQEPSNQGDSLDSNLAQPMKISTASRGGERGWSAQEKQMMAIPLPGAPSIA